MSLCTKCGQEVEADDLYLINGQALCEDCALGAQQAPKPCDVWAVRIATNTRQNLGQRGAEGLSEIQGAILEYITNNCGATAAEICGHFHLAEEEMRREFAVLRHCQLGRATKQGDQVYYVPWDYQG